MGFNPSILSLYLLLSLMEISSPQFVLERSAPSAFTHKLWRVREEIMICVCNTLNTFGSTSLSLSKFVPNIIKLVSDAQVSLCMKVLGWKNVISLEIYVICLEIYHFSRMEYVISLKLCHMSGNLSFL